CVAAHDLEAEAGLDLELPLSVRRRPRVTEPNGVVGVVGTLGLAHQDLEHRADGVELGRLVATGGGDEIAGGEAGEEHEAPNGREVMSRSSLVSCNQYGKPSPAMT